MSFTHHHHDQVRTKMKRCSRLLYDYMSGKGIKAISGYEEITTTRAYELINWAIRKLICCREFHFPWIDYNDLGDGSAAERRRTHRKQWIELIDEL